MRLTLMLAAAIFSWVSIAAAEETGVRVRGQSRIEVPPDMAIVTIGVSTEAGTAEEALQRNSDRMTDVLSRLRSSGVEDRDLQTSGLTLSPVYDSRQTDEGPQIRGYAARNVVTVRVRQLDGLGEVLGAAVEDGANTIERLVFGLQNPEDLEERARAAAVENAISKARQFAQAAGVELGAVLAISEEDETWRPVEMLEARMMSDAVPIAEGEVAVEATVSVRFGLAE